MNLELVFMLIGFALASYSVIGNDAIQTLGTFLSSNSKRPWWVLWLFASGILVLVVLYGVFIEGDISFEKFDGTFIDKETGEDKYPKVFNWWFVIPPLVLLLVTRFGIPVSTTFLIVSVFAPKAIESMLIKSGTGYILAFGIAIIVYLAISKFVEKHFIETHTGEVPSLPWVVAQWISTGFLWSMWLIQDMVNIFVYLYRPVHEHNPNAPWYLFFGTVLLVGIQALLFYYRGGSIQKIVTSKTNTTDIRSATIVDFIYGLILLFFKGPIPMSTTWVFVGLLAGREIAITLMLNPRPMKAVLRIVLMDFGKVILGLVISVALVLMITQLG